MAYKMTDNEIIKALECCTSWVCGLSCADCPLHGTGCVHFNKLKETLDLINRQKAEIQALREDIHNRKTRENKLRSKIKSFRAEIERLKGYVTPVVQLVNEYDIMVAKAEAIKEFAERLKEKSSKISLVYSGDVVKTDYTINGAYLDNLVKEMVGDTE